MHSIRVHKVIAGIVSLLYLIGVWHHRKDKPTKREMGIKFFYCIHYSLFCLSLAVGSMNSENGDGSIFLAEISIAAAVLAIKFCLFTWKQNEILDLLDRVCVFSIRNDDDHKRFDDKVHGFMTFVIAFVIAIIVAGVSASVVFSLLVGSEKTLFFEIGFPLDYRNNEIAFWIAFAFLLSEVLLSMTVIIFTIVIWYLLLTCSLRYELLGSELKSMGGRTCYGKRMLTEGQMRNNFIQDAKASIDAHLHLRELTNDLEVFFSDIFSVQFAASGLCICGSVYCLAFDIGDNLLERFIYLSAFFYFIADLFMITYFGNEIKLSSDRLSYSLFESDWYNQPQSTKICIIIFSEYLKQPQQLVIAKLYPLTLETFTRILHSAYSMFNILKSFK